MTCFEQRRRGGAGRRRDVRRGDLVLVKGSRGTRTDVVAIGIAAEFA